LQQFQPFEFVNSNKATTEHGLDAVHLDSVSGEVLKNQVVINQVKNPIFTACSSKSNKPAFKVKLLAENSILLIKETSYPAEILFLKILKCYLEWQPFLSPNG
jgi:hypothetical protein